MMAGLAMNVSEAGTEHCLAHPLGTLRGIPHGLTVGVMLLESLQHDGRFVPERLDRVADAMGEPDDGTRDGSRALRAVERFLAEVGCPTLTELGVTDDDVATLTATARTGWIPIEPGPWTDDDIAAAYRRALARSPRAAHP
jgi:alcohol dehydrogenase